jgi:uncharacterized protein YjiS (DUF1127 family)
MAHAVRRAADALRLRQATQVLCALDDRQLADIGLTRGAAEFAAGSGRSTGCSPGG